MYGKGGLSPEGRTECAAGGDFAARPRAQLSRGRSGGGEVALRYLGGSGGAAAVLVDGPTKVLVLGFPLEAIDHPADREAVVQRILDHTL